MKIPQRLMFNFFAIITDVFLLNVILVVFVFGFKELIRDLRAITTHTYFYHAEMFHGGRSLGASEGTVDVQGDPNLHDIRTFVLQNYKDNGGDATATNTILTSFTPIR